ncbi:hypothetical protein ABTX62_34740 [Streptomyces sp. NPDC096046]|uniref:hypothetical protein n=1 Tax=Streptomyces sp. NPDC096046 TaxID=3155542 RepID=UPI00332BD6C1
MTQIDIDDDALERVTLFPRSGPRRRRSIDDADCCAIARHASDLTEHNIHDIA